jgi:hypothetical protein
MRQKMEFLLQDGLDAVPPDDTELRTFFDENRHRYRDTDRLTFTQVFLGENASARQIAEWRALTKEPETTAQRVETVAQPSLLPERMELAAPEGIALVFGETFSRNVLDAPAGKWSGPLESAYGWHLVWIEDRSEGGAPTLQEVRAQVVRDLMYEKRQKAEMELIERLKRNYEIVFEEQPE